jgi:hypothetical protein
MPVILKPNPGLYDETELVAMAVLLETLCEEIARQRGPSPMQADELRPDIAEIILRLQRSAIHEPAALRDAVLREVSRRGGAEATMAA